MWNMTSSFVWHDTYVWHDLSTCVTWLFHTCNITHICDMSHPLAWHDSLPYSRLPSVHISDFEVCARTGSSIQVLNVRGAWLNGIHTHRPPLECHRSQMFNSKDPRCIRRELHSVKRALHSINVARQHMLCMACVCVCCVCMCVRGKDEPRIKSNIYLK